MDLERDPLAPGPGLMDGPGPQGVLALSAPAKVNLCLGVGERLPGGYHGLVSLVATVTLADRVELEHAARLDVLCDHPEVPGGEANLAYRAARLLGEAAAREPRVRIRIAKRIPVAAGLAGGSADAAAVLRGLCRVWGLDWSPASLTRMALRLGADVPFCLRGGVARMEGVGEQLVSLDGLPTLSLVLAAPRGARISTAAAYRALDRRRPAAGDLKGARARLELAVEAWRRGDLEGLAGLLFNDLEPVAVQECPGLATLAEAMRSRGALGVVVSGSGPTLIGMVRDGEHAQAVARALEEDGFWAVPVETQGIRDLD